jgi:glycosyltransferase involved in cell wall biosynthesis
MKISVIIPVFNERPTIEQILLRVQAVGLDKEIIVIDDGSTDGTRELLADLARYGAADRGAMMLPQAGQVLHVENIRVLFQEGNHGKGAALRRGFQEARGDVVIVQDADLEYDPENFYSLIEPIVRGEADVVYGSRFLGGPHRVLFFWHYVGNKLLTTLSDMFTDLNLSDVWTCYKAFRREVLAQLDLREKRFGIEQEITSKVAKAGWRVYEVPISYYGRTYQEGKKITWRDGMRGLWCILRYAARTARHADRHEAASGPAVRTAERPVADRGVPAARHR